MATNTLPAGPEYRVVPDCPGYMAGSDGTLWSCWTKGRWPKRTDTWLPVRTRQARKDRGHLHVILRTASGLRVTDSLHRLILITFTGPPPEGMICCHDPDPNPANCAVDNLRWATPTENVEDCKRHGRFAWGDRHPNAKIRDDDVPAIFDLRRAGLTHGDIAKRYGVRRVVITRVLLGHRYRHVSAERDVSVVRGQGNYARGERQAQAKLTDAAVAEMRKLRTAGWLLKDLAARFGVSQGTVSWVINGKAWKHVT